MKIGRITPAGTITELNAPGTVGSPFSITAGPDGNLWYLEPAAGDIVQIHL
jgi:virginiamycin B lyase